MVFSSTLSFEPDTIWFQKLFLQSCSHAGGKKTDPENYQFWKNWKNQILKYQFNPT